MKRQNTPIAMANNALVTGPSVAEQNHAGVYFEHYNINANTVNAFSGKFESCLFEVGKGVRIEDKSNDEKTKEETTPKTTMHSYGINKHHTSSKEKQFVTDLPVFSNVIQDQDDSTNSSFPGIIGQPNSSALVQSDAFEYDQSDSHTLDLFDDLSNSRHKHTKKITAEHIHRTVPYEKKFRSECNGNDFPSLTFTENISDYASESESLDSGFDGDIYIINKVRGHGMYKKHSCFKINHIKKTFKRKKSVKSTRLNKQLRRKMKAVSRRIVFGNNQSTTLVFGLGSYFDRLNTGPTPSFGEQMHYEWLRFVSFQNYSGSGSIIQLARHGFYHNPDDGPTSTRCVYCNVLILVFNWECFDDIALRHRQMSINCPIHLNSNPDIPRQFINYPIRDNNNDSARIETSQSVFNQIPSSPRLSLSVREVCRIYGNQVNPMANPETIVAEVESTADAESQSVFSPNEVARRNFNQYYHDQPADVAHVPDAEDLGVSTRWNQRNEPLDQFGAVGGVDDMHPINQVHISNVIQDQHDAIVVDQNLCIEMQDTAEESVMLNPHTPSTSEINHSIQMNPQLFSNTPFSTKYDKKGNNAEEYSPELTFRNINANLTENGEHEDGLDTNLSQESECEGAVGGVSDGVRCFYCGVGIEQWTSGDDPLNEHKRWSPSCGYLKIKLGEENESPGPHDQNQQTLQNRVPKKKVRSKVPHMKQLLFDEIDDDSESKERSGNTSDGNLSDENELLRSSLLCHVCLDRSNIIRLPCGHLMTCSCCTNRSLQCLICNKCSGINSQKS